MLRLLEIDTSAMAEAFLAPSSTDSYGVFSQTWVLILTILAAVGLGACFAWVVSKLFPKPRADWMGRADFGLNEIDMALLVPLGVVFLSVASIAGGFLTMRLEPEAITSAQTALRELNLQPAEFAEKVREVRDSLGAEEQAQSVYARHAGTMLSAFVLCLYVPLMLWITRDRRLPSEHAAKKPYVAGETLRPSPAVGGLWRMLPAFGVWVPLSLALGWVSWAVVWHVMGPSEAPPTQEVLDRLTTSSPLMVPASILSAVVAAPLFEEFLFRGVIQGGLRRFLPFPIACLIPVVLFTAVHDIWTSYQILIPVAGLGLALGWVYERTGNIWYAVTLHAMHNGATLAMAHLAMG